MISSMSKRSSTSSLLAVCFILLLVGESEGKLKLSLATDAITAAEITLQCSDLSHLHNDIDSANGIQMMDQHNEESLRFELNNSIIHPNSTLLHNYSVEKSVEHQYIAHFQLDPYEVFLGNFTCRSNYTVSNDVLLAYLPVNVVKNLTTSLPPTESDRHLEVVIFAMGISLSIVIVVTVVLCIGLLVMCCKTTSSLASSDQLESWSHSSNRPSWSRDSIIQFTVDGNAELKRSLAQLANGKELEKQVLHKNVQTLSKKVIVRVLKYLLHPADCSRTNCLCEEVKKEYNTLVNELNSTIDSPCETESATVPQTVEHETAQGQSRPQSLTTQDGNRNHSVLTVEKEHPSSYFKDGCSLAPSSIHYPKLSPAASPVLEVSYVDPVERVMFDSKGGRYFNQDHGIGLKVPPGAVPEGDQVTIEIGVSLSCPILFPAGTKPVSPMLSMCVIDNPNYQFLKPVEVRLAHCLDIATKEDVTDLEIGFVKSGHNLFCFHKTEGKSTFEPGTHCGIFMTKHFCFFCIVANRKKADLTKINYRLIKVVPKSTSLRWKARYCITYFLPTCLQALEKQYCPQQYNIQSLQRFKFVNRPASDSKPYVGVSFERRIVGGWNLALETSDKIYARDVDFWDIESSELEQMESEELYPPRFVIDVCGTQAHATGQVWVNFSGMTTEFKSELILDASRVYHYTGPTTVVPAPWADPRTTIPYSQSTPSLSQSFAAGHSHQPPYCLTTHLQEDFTQSMTNVSQGSSSGSVTSLDSTGSGGPTHRDLMNKIAVAAPTKWREIGIQLGLNESQLGVIEQKHSFNPIACFSEVFTEWRRRMTSPCSWSTIIDALKSPLVGENVLAQKLQTELENSSGSSTHSDSISLASQPGTLE